MYFILSDSSTLCPKVVCMCACLCECVQFGAICSFIHPLENLGISWEYGKSTVEKKRIQSENIKLISVIKKSHSCVSLPILEITKSCSLLPLN